MSVQRATPADLTLEITRIFNAPRRLVFAAWTKPEYVVRWWGPKDFTLPEYALDFRIGGAYRYLMRSPAGTDHPVHGVFREIVPPERLVFTWERDDEEGKTGSGTIVTVTFEDLGSKTKLRLHQTQFQTVEGRDGHVGGWTECLERLVAHVEHELAAQS